MLRARRRTAALCACLALCAGTAGARADEPPEAQATKAFVEGSDAIDAGRLAEGCSLIEKSFGLYASVNAQFRLAECRSKLGLPGRAALDLAAVRARVARDLAAKPADAEVAAQLDQLSKDAAALATTLAPRLATLPHLTIDLADEVKKAPDLAIILDGIKLDAAATTSPIPVDAGHHVLLIEARGKKPLSKDIDVISASQTQHVASLEEIAPPPMAPTAPTATAVAVSPPPPAPPPFGGRNFAIGIALTTGLVGMAMGVGYGITFEIARDSYKKDCNPDLCRDGRTNQRTYDDTMALLLPEGISFVAGGAGLAAAGVLYLTLPQSGGRSESVRIAPQIGPNHAVIAASGSF